MQKRILFLAHGTGGDFLISLFDGMLTVGRCTGYLTIRCCSRLLCYRWVGIRQY